MTRMTRRVVESHDIESIMQWFEDEIGEGENGILVYPNSPTFREIYTQYAKDLLVFTGEGQQPKDISQDNTTNNGNDVDNDNDNDNKKNNRNRRNEEQLMIQPRILLIATFYDTVNTVKHNLSAVGVDVQSHIDDGSLLIVDAFNAYYPDIDGMKKLVASLSERARKEGRAGVSAIVNTGFFFLYGRDIDSTNLTSYEASLAPKTDGNNVRGFSCYHAKNYRKIRDSQKKELLTEGQKKKMLEVIESAVYSM
jgi:hypothetical protein